MAVFTVSSSSLDPIDGVGVSANQNKGGEKLPGVLQFELFRRHQVLRREPTSRTVHPDRGVFRPKRRSLKES